MSIAINLSLPVMEHIAPHLIAFLNSYSLTHLSEKFQKFFPDSRDAFENRNIGASTDFSNFLIAEIVQRMKQKPLPLFLGAEGQHRKNFLTVFASVGGRGRCGDQAFFDK